MMKLYKLFILSASVFLLSALSGCSKEEDAFTTLPEGGLPEQVKSKSDYETSSHSQSHFGQLYIYRHC